MTQSVSVEAIATAIQSSAAERHSVKRAVLEILASEGAVTLDELTREIEPLVTPRRNDTGGILSVRQQVSLALAQLTAEGAVAFVKANDMKRLGRLSSSCGYRLLVQAPQSGPK